MRFRFLWYMFDFFHPPPIFIIPGLGGSVIYNSITGETLYPPKARAFMSSNKFLSDFNVSYVDRKFVSNVPSFVGPIGDTKHIKVVRNWMAPFLKHYYFDSFIHYFKTRYPRHEMKSVPYDFRLIGNHELRESLKLNLREAIEEETERIGKRSVLIAHSLGGLVLHDFLLEQNSTWKETHIEKVITINTPYLGTVKALGILCCGQRVNKPLLKKIDYLMNFSAFFWLIPNPYFEKEKIINQETNTTVSSLKDLVADDVWERIEFHFQKELLQLGNSNGVTTHIIYSSNIPTVCTLHGETKSSSLGDGMICLDSLVFPKQWENSDLVHLHPIEDYDHTKILNSKTLFDLILAIIKTTSYEN